MSYRNYFLVFGWIGLNLGLISCSLSGLASDSTRFLCENDNNQWVTKAQRDNIVSEPLFIWNTTEFGDKFTPEIRCHTVSARLNNFVSNNGGRLNNLALKDGPLKEKTVICVTKNGGESCNDNNLLVTLNTANAENPSQVINDIRDFANSPDNSNPILENGKPSESVILLESFVNSKLANGKEITARKMPKDQKW